MTDRMDSVRFKAAVSLIFLIAIIFYVATQERVRFGDGYPYDGAEYVRMANEYSADRAVSAHKPFVYRIGVPYIVGKLFPGQVLLGFMIVNLFFGILILALLFAYLRQYSSNRVVVASLVFLFLSNPHGPIRFSQFFPAFTDAPALFAILSILYLGKVWKGSGVAKVLTIAALSFVGVLFREIVILAPLSLLGACIWSIWRGRHGSVKSLRFASAVIPVIAGTLGIALTHRLVIPEAGDYTFRSHAIFSLLRHAQYPTILFAALLAAYGPVISVVVVYLRGVVQVLLSDNGTLGVYLAGIFVLAVLGGTHTDRFFYWGFPAVLPVLAVILEKLDSDLDAGFRKTMLYLALVIAQVLAFRIFWQIPNADFDALNSPGMPEWVLFAPYGAAANGAQMHASYMSEVQRAIMLTEYAAMVIYALFARKVLARRVRAEGEG